MLRRSLAAGALATLALVCGVGPVRAGDIIPPAAANEAQTLTLEWNGDAETVPVRGYGGYHGGGYHGGGYRGGYGGGYRGGYGGGGYRWSYGGYRGFYGGYRSYYGGYRGYYPWRYAYGYGYPYYYGSYYAYPSVSIGLGYYQPFGTYYYPAPVYFYDFNTSGEDVMPYTSTLETTAPRVARRRSGELVSPPRVYTPDQGGYRYDGGPNNPVPQPRAEPAPMSSPPTQAPPKGQLMTEVRAPARFTYPAYGGTLKRTPPTETATVLVKEQVAKKSPR